MTRILVVDDDPDMRVRVRRPPARARRERRVGRAKPFTAKALQACVESALAVRAA